MRASLMRPKVVAPARISVRAVAPSPARLVSAAAEAERLRLHNLGPAKGARRAHMRKGRGHSAGQGQSCGFGMRGQKARSGPGTRPGFEGGQIPLYRRLPKLKGIAGGMGAGLPDYVVINLGALSGAYSEGETVTLQSLKERNVVNVSGREARLPLKVLGDGELSFALTIRAAQYSKSAKDKIEAAGGSALEAAVPQKWTRKAHEARVKAQSGQAKKLVTGRKKKLAAKAGKAK